MGILQHTGGGVDIRVWRLRLTGVYRGGWIERVEKVGMKVGNIIEEEISCPVVTTDCCPVVITRLVDRDLPR